MLAFSVNRLLQTYPPTKSAFHNQIGYITIAFSLRHFISYTPGRWPSNLMNFPSLRLAGAVGARINVRSSYLQRGPPWPAWIGIQASMHGCKPSAFNNLITTVACTCARCCLGTVGIVDADYTQGQLHSIRAPIDSI